MVCTLPPVGFGYDHERPNGERTRVEGIGGILLVAAAIFVVWAIVKRLFKLAILAAVVVGGLLVGWYFFTQ